MESLLPPKTKLHSVFLLYVYISHGCYIFIYKNRTWSGNNVNMVDRFISTLKRWPVKRRKKESNLTNKEQKRADVCVQSSMNSKMSFCQYWNWKKYIKGQWVSILFSLPLQLVYTAEASCKGWGKGSTLALMLVAPLAKGQSSFQKGKAITWKHLDIYSNL